MESLGDYCIVCGQHISAGDVSASLNYRRAHIRCADTKYASGVGMPKITLVAKKINDHKFYIGSITYY